MALTLTSNSTSNEEYTQLGPDGDSAEISDEDMFAEGYCSTRALSPELQQDIRERESKHCTDDGILLSLRGHCI